MHGLVAEVLENFLLAFIPLFVAVDPVGVLPLYLGISQGVEPVRRRRIAHQATITALVVAVSFMFLGKWIFRMMNITVPDFQIAGGLILLALATYDMVVGSSPVAARGEEFGVVPLGLPLIVGPATLTTLVIVMDSVGTGYALAGLLTNLALVNLSFRFSDTIARWIGLPGLRAISKITSLLLAAIAVSMIRRGAQAVWLG
ncbi:MAG: MarC family protein [Verrucomicrobiae bacterium]|nr:MarC family protein [Verrucomicrobiae bacterium]MDW8343580.1 MarC family protein [Verrucomicrobiae bacterium]